MTLTPDLIVFDLDGTLVDSLPDIAAAGNYALGRLGFPEQPLPVYQQVIGGGEKNFVRRLLGLHRQGVYEQSLNLYLEYYSQHPGDHSRVYPGVAATLAQLSPVKKAVLSNKRADLARQVLNLMGLAGFFEAVRGTDSYGVLKPSPEGLAALIREMGRDPGRTFMVGDKPEDVLAGRGAGAQTVALTYGYGDPEALAGAAPDFTFSSFSALADFFN